eukprot:179130-Chlamydomonas_euryale.AAC.4
MGEGNELYCLPLHHLGISPGETLTVAEIYEAARALQVRRRPCIAAHTTWQGVGRCGQGGGAHAVDRVGGVPQTWHMGAYPEPGVASFAGHATPDPVWHDLA